MTERISTSHAMQGNIAAYVAAITALKGTKVGAGVGGSGTKITGETIDRLAHNLPLSMLFSLSINTTLASGQTLTAAFEIKHSDDGQSWSPFGLDEDNTQPDDQVVTANNDGSAIVTALSVGVDLSGAKQYVQVNVTPTLTHSGSDVATIAGVGVLGGPNTLPAI